METFAFLTPIYLCRRHMAVPCTHVESHGFFARHLQGGKSLRTDVEGDCERSNLISWLEILFGTLEDMRRRYFFYLFFSSLLLFSWLPFRCALSYLISRVKKLFFCRKRCQNTLLIWRASPPTPPPSTHPPAGTLTDGLRRRLKLSTLATLACFASLLRQKMSFRKQKRKTEKKTFKDLT